MKKLEFTKLVEEQLRQVFKEAQLGTRSNKAKYRAEGFIQCGRVMGLVSDYEMTSLMDRVHKEVFNLSIEERKTEKLKLSEQMAANDYKDLYIPAFLRDSSYNKLTE